jgi:hypothetical protein
MPFSTHTFVHSARKPALPPLRKFTIYIPHFSFGSKGRNVVIQLLCLYTFSEFLLNKQKAKNWEMGT